MDSETALSGSILVAIALAAVAVFAPHVLPGTALVYLAEYAVVGIGSAVAYYLLSD